MKNSKIIKVRENYYIVKADSERFGEQAIVFEGISEDECRAYIRKCNAMIYDAKKAKALEMLKNMPESKKATLQKALTRNYLLTSAYTLEHGVLTVYTEGYYLELKGTRSSFKVWMTKEGTIERKPNYDKLHKNEETSIRFDEADYFDYT